MKNILLCAILATSLASIVFAEQRPISYEAKGAELKTVLAMAARSAGMESPRFVGGVNELITLNIVVEPKRALPELCSIFGVMVESRGGGSTAFVRDEASLKISPVSLSDVDAARLRGLPPVCIEMKQASLAAAVQMLAESAGQNYIFEPSDLADLDTISEFASPWTTLERLCAKHHIEMTKTQLGWLFTKRHTSVH